MRKMLVIAAAALFTFVLAGCDFYGTTTTTTTVSTETPETLSISTAAELLAVDVTKSYLLTADIDLAGAEWEPIGTPDDPFAGTFDGDGHTISNFQITHANANMNGLFGVVTGDLVDLNVTGFVIDITTSYLTYAGGLVAHTTGSLTGCTASGSIDVTNNAATAFVGLLAGYVAAFTTDTMTIDEFVAGVLTDCHASGSIVASADHFLYVGGLVGKTYNVEVTDSSAQSTISASCDTYRLYVGGLIGHNYGGILKPYADQVDDATIGIVRCYAEATMNLTASGTKAAVGGLIGYSQDAVIEDCFAYVAIAVAGAVIDIGGLIGEDWYDTIASVVAKVELVVAISTEQTIRFGGVAGFLHAESTVNDAYRLVYSSTASTNLAGTAVTITALADMAWYQNELGWSAATFDLASVIDILS